MKQAVEGPAPEVAAHIRATAERMQGTLDELLAEIGRQLAPDTPEVPVDPVMIQEIAASNRDTVERWVHANRLRPGHPVPADLTAQILDVARDMVRRGVDERYLVQGYWRGHNLLWRYWMSAALAEPGPPEVLAAALDLAARSMSRFVDRTLTGVQRHVEHERDQLVGGMPARRMETVNLLLEGAPIPEDRASARLGYDLRGRHLALVLWHAPGTVEQGELESAADTIAEAAGARRPLTVAAGISVLWAWIAVQGEVDTEALDEALVATGTGVRAAAGLPGTGAAGFRLSHQQALTAQRLAFRMHRPPHLTAYEDVQVVAMAGHEEGQAREFVAVTLGELAEAPPELARTLRVYLQEDCNASRAARRLYTHRNTVLNRIARADALLPRPRPGRGLQIGLALELQHWLGRQE
ncbi:helix-turn-helix domain-containing protein [Kitasatospora sp. YST-16]|uniref:PucR family transcriptional regulator n=1 Tax=Kitasatospora sp. YST-16 TaxID=2998080 RepID=UPI002283FD7D|nr:helix-turn-helix domain-containing protein [Kitasatospora sp. YST-16]WAL74648.1 helix-turn-helix domain-containing protein [Kitasatospora sp. YST-16]WNW40706.1 helix-turn-helix domain-containing protein [Streptomyces sp. Li-HN-5-13]